MQDQFLEHLSVGSSVLLVCSSLLHPVRPSLGSRPYYGESALSPWAGDGVEASVGAEARHQALYSFRQLRLMCMRNSKVVIQKVGGGTGAFFRRES